MSIKYQFNLDKALEASAMFLTLQGQPLDSLVLLKMLSLAEYKTLEQIEAPLIGGDYLLTPNGIIISQVQDLIYNKSSNQPLSIWFQFISFCPQTKIVTLEKDPGNDNLCEEEEEIIKNIYETFSSLDSYTTSQWSDYQKNSNNCDDSLIFIPVEEIFKSLGKTDQEITMIYHESLRESYLEQTL